MSEQLADQLRNITLKSSNKGDIGQRFTDRLKEGKLTRDENPETHYCVYFAAYDPKNGKVFIGHHKKSDFEKFVGQEFEELDI